MASAKPIEEVSVRTLAEFACKRAGMTDAAAAAGRLREGREGHEAIQSRLDPGWRTEAPAKIDLELDDITLRITGRADALKLHDDLVHVAEIKTTRADPQDIEADDYPEHRAQAEIYAWIFCRQFRCSRAEVTVLYVGINGGRREFSAEYAYDRLDDIVRSTVHPYAKMLMEQRAWRVQAEETIEEMPFPFETYREGQQDMIDCVYNAMVNGERALIEAPTGIGKTAASLYGALKALGEGKITCVFYLTARTTGRRAAENAIDLMRSKGLKCRSVTLTAKEKICFKGKPDCGSCPYGDNYYGRRSEALRQAWNIEKYDERRIRALGERFELCPFELSLDLSNGADVVICDYNYVFDPRVLLRRRFEKKSKTGLLIDEAHNLADRAREMYSAVLNGEQVRIIRDKNLQMFGPQDELCGALNALLKELTDPDAEYDARSIPPQAVTEAATAFTAVAEKLKVSDEETQNLVYEAQWFIRVAKHFDENSYRLLITPLKPPLIEVRLWCWAPEKYIDRVFSRVGGAALFSATLAPIDFYARALSVEDKKNQLVLDSPFPRENLFTARIPISVKYRDREETLEQVARVIRAMMETHTGNYMVCFPSYAYLTQVFKYYHARFPKDRIIRQEPYMTERRRMDFIAQFQSGADTSLAAFVVLGGVFSEGVDLPDDLLSGVAILSTGIPQVNPEAELLRELYDDGGDGGQDTAYTYPGFRRVLQAAGRVIRTETDRGIVLLLDARYAAEKYTELFPSHWRVHKISSMSKLNAALGRFWGRERADDRI